MVVAKKTAAKKPATKTGAEKPKLRGGLMGTIDNMRKSAKRGGGLTQNIPKDGIMNVRFLEEPDQWVGYFEVFDKATNSFYPQVDGDQATSEQTVSFKYLVNALDIDQDKVIALKLPKSLGVALLKKYDRVNTVMDRDYELSRTGSGLDTSYDVDSEGKSKRNIAKYELLDLMEILEQSLDDASTTPAPSKKAASPVRKSAAARSAAADDEDEEEEEETPKPRKKTAKKPVAEEEEEDEEEEDEEEEDEEEEDEDEEEEESEEEDEDEEEIELSEEDLQAMSLAKLRSTAAEFDVETKGKSKAAIVAAIMALAE